MVETVLVVEDDQQVRTLVTTILKKLGHRTVEATNAWQALAALPWHLLFIYVNS